MAWPRPKCCPAPGNTNPRFVGTSLSVKDEGARWLYEDLHCARGERENRIKECQLELFAGRTSMASFGANQLRLWLPSFAHVLIEPAVALARSVFCNRAASLRRVML